MTGFEQAGRGQGPHNTPGPLLGAVSVSSFGDGRVFSEAGRNTPDSQQSGLAIRQSKLAKPLCSQCFQSCGFAMSPDLSQERLDLAHRPALAPKPLGWPPFARQAGDSNEPEPFASALWRDLKRLALSQPGRRSLARTTRGALTWPSPALPSDRDGSPSLRARATAQQVLLSLNTTCLAGMPRGHLLQAAKRASGRHTRSSPFFYGASFFAGVSSRGLRPPNCFGTPPEICPKIFAQNNISCRPASHLARSGR